MDPSDVEFGRFRIDRAEQRLYRGTVAVELRPQAWELLLLLVSRPNTLLSFDELNAALWPDTIVAPHALTRLVSDLRQALGTDGAAYVENVPRRGYRFRFTEASQRQAHRHAGAPLADAHPLFVAREAELARLETHWQLALRGQRQFVFISGEPGIGKTALIDEFIKRLRVAAAESPLDPVTPNPAAPFLVARGQCLPLQSDPAPYGPVVEALQRIATERAVRSRLRQYAPAWLLQLPGLLSADESLELLATLAGSGAQRMLNEAAVLLEAVSSDTPLLAVLEDAHWADAATIDLLRTIMQRGETARLLTVVSYRTADIALDRHPLQDVVQLATRIQGGCRLTLGALTEAAIGRFLVQRFANASAAALASLLEQATGGNPLFLGLMTEHLVERGWIDAHDGSWCHAAPLDVLALGMPSSLREMIETRIVAAAQPHLDVLEAAALVGDRFTAVAAAAAAEGSAEAVDDICHALARARQIVRLADAGEPAYEFIHTLYRQVLAQRISPIRARRLHQRIGEYLETAPGTDLMSQAPQLADHFRAAGDRERTASYLELAAANAARCLALRDTRDTLARAIEAIGTLAPSPERSSRESERWLDLANLSLAMDCYDGERARLAYDRAFALATEAANPHLCFRAQLGRCLERALAGSNEAVAIAEALVATAEQGHPELAAVAHTYALMTYYMQCDCTLAFDHGERALRMLPQAATGIPVSYDLATRLHTFRSTLLSLLDRADAARVEHRLALERAEASGRPAEIIDVVLWRAHDCIVRDEALEMRALAERTMELATKYGVQTLIELVLAYRAWASLRLNAAGIDELEVALRAPLLQQALWTQELMSISLADEQRRRGNFTAARRALEVTRHLRRRYIEPERWRILGQILLDERAASGAPTTAAGDPLSDGLSGEQCLQRAVALAERQGAVLFEQRARRALKAAPSAHPVLAPGDDSQKS